MLTFESTQALGTANIAEKLTVRDALITRHDKDGR